METRIVKLLGHKRARPATLSEILHRLSLAPDQQALLQSALQNLEEDGRVVRVKGGRYLSCDSPALVSGRIQITKGGRGFLAPEDPAIPEISIRASDTGAALHDDRVLVLRDPAPEKRLWQAAGPGALTGAVVQVLERRRTRFVGTLRRSGSFLSVAPDDPRFTREISVPPAKASGRQAKAGDKVVVELTKWSSPRTDPQGRIVEVLGAPAAEGVDMLGVLRHYGLDAEFPAEVVKEARSFGRTVTPAEIRGRRDCRAQQVITIDPDDARDFDDAICLEPAGSGRWKLWVHIADVSHYVRPGSALDIEAKRRGNSSYLVDRVIPMLPEELSNELCSLKPRVDRLTKCVEFLLTAEGKVVRADFYPAVIHSQRRLTYGQAMAALEQAPRDAVEEMLHQASRLAQLIRKRRFEAGSLDLDFPETKIRLDAQGRVERIERQENDLSHQLVEEFMLLANEAAAGKLMKMKRPAIYRVHEAPDPDRLHGYRQEVLSHAIPCGDLNKPAEVRKLFVRLGGQAIGSALKIGFLKSLSRARYTEDPLGHYGLAKKKYAHFTSPIRRYADLVAHRGLFAAPADARLPLREVAAHLSASERNSADAERDSKDVKLHAYLLDQIRSGRPASYPARVTSLHGSGFFVDVAALGMSGMVPLSLLHDDRYRHDAAANHIQGRDKRRVIRLGDLMDVEVAKVDPARKMVDFRVAGAPRAATGGGRTRARGEQRDAAQPPRETIPAGKKAPTEGARRRRSSRSRRSRESAQA